MSDLSEEQVGTLLGEHQATTCTTSATTAMNGSTGTVHTDEAGTRAGAATGSSDTRAADA